MLDPFLIAMLLATLILLVVTRLATERLIRQHHGQKRDFFHHHPIHPGDIVMLGDSLTDGARWEEIFPGQPMKNRGINADLTTGVITRLDDILAGKPAVICILIGTNDLPWYEYRHNTDILASYRQILQKIHDDSPDTAVIVQSIFPRDRMYTKRIIFLNGELKKLAADFGYTYLDLFTHLVDERGQLRRDLTNDGLHLLAGGYAIWQRELSPLLKDYFR